MSTDRYSHFEDGAAFGLLANALFDGGRDEGAAFPRSDAEDLSRGVRFIPGNVTEARRRGEVVELVLNCGPCCWYWQMANGSREYHYDPLVYERIGRHNHGKSWNISKVLAGPCPRCGNPHTNGGSMSCEEVDGLGLGNS